MAILSSHKENFVFGSWWEAAAGQCLLMTRDSGMGVTALKPWCMYHGDNSVTLDFSELTPGHVRVKRSVFSVGSGGWGGGKGCVAGSSTDAFFFLRRQGHWPLRLVDGKAVRCRCHGWLSCLEGQHLLAVAPEEKVCVDGGDVLGLFCAQCGCGFSKLGLGAQKDQYSVVQPSADTLGSGPGRRQGVRNRSCCLLPRHSQLSPLETVLAAEN